MKFSRLIKDLQLEPQHDFIVSGVTTDSRKVRENFIFFAIRGENVNGEDFIASAVEKGAKAIFCSDEFKKEFKNVNIFRTSKIQKVLSFICERFFAPLPENITAVTGTNGKTSVANFTAQLMKLCGRPSASIGTLGTLLDGDYEKQFSYSGLTSPDIITLFEDLQDLKGQGIDDVCIEASSHGLHQGRMGELQFKAGAFTNFTQDHLDYHGDMDQYFEAKMMLFTNHLQADSTAVLNADIDECVEIQKICNKKGIRTFTFGERGSNILLEDIRAHDKGLDIRIGINRESVTIPTKLIGAFQAYNVLASIGIALSLGLDKKMVLAAAGKLKPVKGRMDVIDAPKQKAKLVIDYAHTPDALEKAIDSLRKHTSGRLITVFGCGGNRDKTKRPLMGNIAVKKSDIVIVTDDNPRKEVAAEIRKEIMAAAKGAVEVPGRVEAIKHAISLLKEGDSILLAGKGHEDYQIIGTEKLPFDEFAIVREILNNV